MGAVKHHFTLMIQYSPRIAQGTCGSLKNALNPTPLRSDLLQLRKPCLHLGPAAKNVPVSFLLLHTHRLRIASQMDLHLKQLDIQGLLLLLQRKSLLRVQLGATDR